MKNTAISKKDKSKINILLSPHIFLCMGAVEVILFCFTSYYFRTHHFFDPTGKGGLWIFSLQLTILLIGSITLIIYGIILKILQSGYMRGMSSKIFKFFSIILIILFIVGLAYFFMFWNDPYIYAKPPNIPGYPNLLY
jgi:hypothetical protein